MGWIIGSSLQARSESDLELRQHCINALTQRFPPSARAVSIYSLVDGSVAADYTTPLNTQLQTSATVRMDRNYCGGARAWVHVAC